MSEPFWKGKTLKELEGKRVKATFKNGAFLEGVLNDEGKVDCGRYWNGDPALAIIFKNVVRPLNERSLNSYVESVTLVDDPEYERIEDFDDVRVGDIAVFTNGNRHAVVNVNREDRLIKLSFSEAGGGSGWADDSRFDYALRRKPRLPDLSGLWVDVAGALWSFAPAKTNPLVFQGTCIRRGGEWLPTGMQTHVYTDQFASDFAPFHPYKQEEDSE